jgi:uncharacterized protein YdhG (YjbR/CyaY superfamily)
MKNAKPSKRAPSAKPRTAPKDFAAYLGSAPKGSQAALKQMRAAIRSVVPRDATEIISYGIPAFRSNEILVWFAAFENHCSLFPKASVIDAFKQELKGFTTSKGTIQFPLDKPLPLVLIKKIVNARVAESQKQKVKVAEKNRKKTP